jgi:hypothetical protein
LKLFFLFAVTTITVLFLWEVAKAGRTYARPFGLQWLFLYFHCTLQQ